MDDAVHGYIRVGLYQAGTQEQVQAVIHDFSEVKTLINDLLRMCHHAEKQLDLTNLNEGLGIIQYCLLVNGGLLQLCTCECVSRRFPSSGT